MLFEDLKKYIPAGVLDPAQYDHELQAPEAKYRLARAVLQEIPRQVLTETNDFNTLFCVNF